MPGRRMLHAVALSAGVLWSSPPRAAEAGFSTVGLSATIAPSCVFRRAAFPTPGSNGEAGTDPGLVLICTKGVTPSVTLTGATLRPEGGTADHESMSRAIPASWKGQSRDSAAKAEVVVATVQF